MNNHYKFSLNLHTHLTNVIAADQSSSNPNQLHFPGMGILIFTKAIIELGSDSPK